MTSGTRTFQIGECSIIRVLECQIPFTPPTTLVAEFDPDLLAGCEASIAPSEPESVSTSLLTSVHSWLLRAPGRTILVDTEVGNDKTRRLASFDHFDTPYLDRLAAAGVMPDDVDHVLLTHIHTDHVGWKTQLVDGSWVPTFTNAIYHVPAIGRDWFQSDKGRVQPNYDMFEDSVLPVIEAGQAPMVDRNGGEMLPGVTCMSTPGHSIDHMSVILASGGDVVMFGGDVMHNPAKVCQPS